MSGYFYIGPVAPVPFCTHPNMIGGRADRTFSDMCRGMYFHIIVVLGIYAVDHQKHACAEQGHQNKFTHRLSFRGSTPNSCHRGENS